MGVWVDEGHGGNVSGKTPTVGNQYPTAVMHKQAVQHTSLYKRHEGCIMTQYTLTCIYDQFNYTHHVEVCTIP